MTDCVEIWAGHKKISGQPFPFRIGLLEGFRTGLGLGTCSRACQYSPKIPLCLLKVSKEEFVEQMLTFRLSDGLE